MSEIRLNTAGLDIAKGLVSDAVGKSVRAIAFAVQEQATENVRDQAAVDTGALLNSIYVETSAENQRAAALAEAKAAAVGKQGKEGRKARRAVRVIEAMPPPPIDDKHRARVASCVEHGAYIEFGVEGSATGNHPPRPFLAPAAVAVQGRAEDVLAAFLKEALSG